MRRWSTWFRLYGLHFAEVFPNLETKRKLYIYAGRAPEWMYEA